MILPWKAIRATCLAGVSGVAVLLATVAAAHGQIPYTSGTYLQTFDGLISTGSTSWSDNTTIPGWRAYRQTGGTAASLVADTGGDSNTGNVYSYGAAGSSNRAIAVLPGGTPGDMEFGVAFTNTSGQVLTSFSIAYDGEEWRSTNMLTRVLKGGGYYFGTPANLGVSGWTSVSPLWFNAPNLSGVGAVSGTNLLVNGTGNCLPNIRYTVGPITWNPGTQLWIRFYEQNQSSGDDGLAVDNFNFSATNSIPPIMTNECLDRISAVDVDLATSGTTNTMRNYSEAAYYLFALNQPNRVAKAEAYLTKLFDKQLSDGNFPWSYNETTNVDPNSISFVMLPIGPLFLQYGSQFDPAFLAYVKPHILSAITALNAYAPTISVAYTNITTMNFVSQMLLGQLEGDTATEANGIAGLNNWTNYTKNAGTSGNPPAAGGIAEYDSPTYEMVDCNALLLGMYNTSDPTSRDRMGLMLDYLSTDLSANYFAPRGTLCGSHSRDYDFIYGDGEIEHFYAINGLRTAPPELELYITQFCWTNFLGNGYQPAPSTLAVSNAPVRTIEQTYGATKGEDRYNYITPDFAIGSSSSYYGPQDKQIAADLTASGTSGLGQISVVYDAFDAPYGLVETVDSSGHSKATHLANAPSTVQSQGTILSISNLSPSLPMSSATCVETNVVFPSNVDKIYLNGSLITTETTAGLNSVLGLREGNSVFAARIFQADGLNGYAPTFAIKFDGPNNMARLVAYHYSGASVTLSATSACAGVFLAAQSVANDTAGLQFLANVQAMSIPAVSGTLWTTSAALASGTLSVSLKPSTNAVVSRKINGAEYVPSRFTVFDGTNTIDYAATLLDPIGTGSNQAPTVATAASATPGVVSGSTTALSVLGADDDFEKNLTYTWAVTGNSPGGVNFSTNGSNAAKNATATFTTSGTYQILATITDTGGLSATSPLTVTVDDNFAKWQAANFTAGQLGNPAVSGTTADPYGLGIPNLLAYALNLSPAAPNMSSFPTASANGSQLMLTYTRSPFKTDISYTVQTSTDLVNWSSSGVDQGGAGPVVTALVTGTGSHVFLRLQVGGGP